MTMTERSQDLPSGRWTGDFDVPGQSQTTMIESRVVERLKTRIGDRLGSQPRARRAVPMDGARAEKWIRT
jgi:hypothetical protein